MTIIFIVIDGSGDKSKELSETVKGNCTISLLFLLS